MGWLGSAAHYLKEKLIVHPAEKLFGIDQEQGEGFWAKAGHKIEDKAEGAMNGIFNSNSAPTGGNTTGGGGTGGGTGGDSDDPDKSKSGGGIGGLLTSLLGGVMGFFAMIIKFIVQLFEGLTGLGGGGDSNTAGGHLGQEVRQKVKSVGTAIEHTEPVKMGERALNRMRGHDAAADVNYLTDPSKMGALVLNKQEAIAEVANYQRESGLNPGAIGDGGHAKGLGQWHEDRQEEFRKMFGHSIDLSSREEQLKFGAYEMKKGKEQKGGREVTEACSVGDAAAAYCRDVERPADKPREAAKSAAFANALAQNPEIRGNGVKLVEVSDASPTAGSTPSPAATGGGNGKPRAAALVHA